jgi:hypothetical protein
MTAAISAGADPAAPVAYPNLASALAAYQAKIPRIGKGDAVTVTGETKDGRPVKYSYSYADLGDMSQVAMPLLGSVGLAFTSRPTFNAKGDFVLAYSLLHTSGEREDGEFPLPDPLRTKPQTLGSAVTYAKRYCFSAITGTTPIGEDDDGREAQREGVMAGSKPWTFDDAAPAAAKPERPAAGIPPDNHWQRSAPGARPVQDAELPPETDMEWYQKAVDEAATFTDPEDGRALWRRVNEKGAAGGLAPDDAKTLRAVITERNQELADQGQPDTQPAAQWPEGSSGEAAQQGAQR